MKRWKFKHGFDIPRDADEEDFASVEGEYEHDGYRVRDVVVRKVSGPDIEGWSSWTVEGYMDADPSLEWDDVYQRSYDVFTGQAYATIEDTVWGIESDDGWAREEETAAHPPGLLEKVNRDRARRGQRALAPREWTTRDLEEFAQHVRNPELAGLKRRLMR